MTLRVYVGGASAEIDRAERMMLRLAEAGIDVVSSWPIAIRKAGTANAGLTDAERAHHAIADVAELQRADVFWLLAPREGYSHGAYFELGYCVAAGKTIVASGPSRQSIFGALATEVEDDEHALALIIAKAKAVG